MKPEFVVASILMLATVPVSAQTGASAAASQSGTAPGSTTQSALPTEAATVATNPSSTGKIIVYRGSSVMGAGIACPIRYKGQEIVELGRGKYAEWDVPAGMYILTNHTSSVQVMVAPGQASYVRCMIKMGFLVGRADLQVVDEQSFDEHSKEFEKKPLEISLSN